MKIVYQILSMLALVTFAACEKVENKVLFEGGTAPNLVASTATVRLQPGEESNTAIRFTWTNPDYKLNTGLSSHDVKYKLEIDTLGGQFNSANKFSETFSKTLATSYTVGQLNSIFGNSMLLRLGREYTFQVRVVASLGTSSDIQPISSNILSFKATPFAPPPKVAPPVVGELFITGAATPGNWMSAGDAPLNSQKFRRESATLYVLDRITLSANNGYLLVPRYGNWSSVAPDAEKYGSVKATNSMNPAGDDFQAGGNDHRSPSVAGDYKIEVNFQTGKTTVTKL